MLPRRPVQRAEIGDLVEVETSAVGDVFNDLKHETRRLVGRVIWAGDRLCTVEIQRGRALIRESFHWDDVHFTEKSAAQNRR